MRHSCSPSVDRTGRLLTRVSGGVIPLSVRSRRTMPAISYLTRPPLTTNGSASHYSRTRQSPVAKPELGSKRQCMSCGAKFYDLNKDPAVCPKCGTVFQAVALSRAAAPVVARAAVKEEEDVELDTSGPELISLDEVEAEEAEKETISRRRYRRGRRGCGRRHFPRGRGGRRRRCVGFDR